MILSRGAGFIERLTCALPEFAPIVAESVRYNDGLLPHVVMGDFTRWFIKKFATARDERNPEAPAAREHLTRAIAFLEREMATADPEVLEIVVTSFLENLHQAGPARGAIESTLGPTVRNWIKGG
jgi:hypothetical protein